MVAVGEVPQEIVFPHFFFNILKSMCNTISGCFDFNSRLAERCWEQQTIGKYDGLKILQWFDRWFRFKQFN